MNNLKNLLKNKKVVIGIVVAVLLVGGVGGYFIYDNNRKTEIMEKMSITFTDKTEIEYGTKDFDVKKELISEVKDAELTDVPKIDTNKIGEVTLKFNLKKDDVVKEVEYKVGIVDTKGPEITLEADSKDLTVGDEYDIKSNIKSVKDVVDGDIALVEDVKTINEKATEEYSKLKKEEITDETVIAEKKISDFFVETTKNEESGEETTHLYLRNCYYIDGSIDVAKAGEYKISIVAVDKNGVKTTKDFTVTVKEKPVVKAPVASSGGGYTSNGGGSSSSGGGSVKRGSKQDIINTAIAQIGKPYQVGATGPDAFDCSGLIWYAYTQNGWSIPRYPEAGGTRIPSSERQPGDIMYTPKSSTGFPHVWLYIGGENKDRFVDSANGGVGYYRALWGVGPNSTFIRY